jgi:uncharacterized protein
MNVDEALRQFARQGFPRDAMAWALDNWASASERFVSKLRAYAAGAERTDAADDEIFCIVHLCGEMRETRAYEPLCRLIANDPDIEIALGDATTETLPGILINVFDGDVAPLMDAIESSEGDEYARSGALEALGYLVRSRGALDDRSMRAFLRRLRQEALPREASGFWYGWAVTAAALGYEDLKMEVALLTKEAMLHATDLDLEDFDRVLDLARSDPAGLAGFHDGRVAPFDDAIGTLESWGRGGENGDEFDDDVFESGADDGYFEGNPFDGTYLNPLREVGRNDPCPCGSGKKYKRCCLGA